MPKFGNRINKGYAFIEFATPEQSEKAVKEFNNVVPIEFVEVNSPNFIDAKTIIRPFKVMSKHCWLEQKVKMKQIKSRIS